MSNEQRNNEVELRYAVDEHPSHPVSALLGFQAMALIIGGIALTPIIVIKAAGAIEYASWVVFAALLVSGLFTFIQARPIGSIGAGYVLFMGTSGAFIAVSIAAIKAGGLPLLATLVSIAALFQFLFSMRLGWLRHIITPTVGGTVITLIAVAILPIACRMLARTPEHYQGGPDAPAIAAVTTFVAMVGIVLTARGQLRLWGPLLGVIIGCVVAFPLGLMDFSRVAEARWVGLPDIGWPGMDFGFGAAFWLMLPGFIICTIVGAMETFGDGIAIQRMSHHEPRPVDYKKVQGAVNADGMGNLVSGLMGTLPNTTYSTSISLVDLTGVASRRVGIYGGIIMMLLAFSPKVAHLLMSIPSPVMGVFLLMLVVLLFVHGVRLVVSGGLSYENGLVFGLSLWVGSAFQDHGLFSDVLPEWARILLSNGMTSGGMMAIVLSLLLRLKTPRAHTLKLPAEPASVSRLNAFLRRLALGQRWQEGSVSRLELAAEEALMFLTDNEEEARQADRQLTVVARPSGGRMEVEFITAPQDSNAEALIQDLHETPALTAGDDSPEASIAEARLRLLRHLVPNLEHLQFNQGDYLMLRIEGATTQVV